MKDLKQQKVSMVWPNHVIEKWKLNYPSATEDDVLYVSWALNDWFDLIKSANKRHLGMPSRSVDLLWHELILETRWYERFCNEHIGFFVHHSGNDSDVSEEGRAKQHIDVVRTWMAACYAEGIDPTNASKVPRLFFADKKICDIKGRWFEVNEPNINEIDPTKWFAAMK
jgi:hypothetical protein